MITRAAVRLWGRTIGAVSLDDANGIAAFQYDPAFARSGIEISPITMPLSDRVYVFPDLPQRTFHGLPGLLADSLPDKFGNALIDAWLATQGRTPESFNAVERLCYTGTRGMGALEQRPGHGTRLPLNERGRARDIQRRGPFPSQRVIHPHRQPERQPRDHHRFMLFRRRGAGHHRDIGPAFGQIGQQAAGIADPRGDFHPWMGGRKPRQKRHREGRAGKSEHQPSAAQLGQVAGGAGEFIHPRQRQPRAHQQGAAILGQLQPAAPMQQPQPASLLQVLHLRRHARLRQPQRLRGRRKPAGIHHGDERTQGGDRDATFAAARTVRIHQIATRKYLLPGYRSSSFPM